MGGGVSHPWERRYRLMGGSIVLMGGGVSFHGRRVIVSHGRRSISLWEEGGSFMEEEYRLMGGGVIVFMEEEYRPMERRSISAWEEEYRLMGGEDEVLSDGRLAYVEEEEPCLKEEVSLFSTGEGLFVQKERIIVGKATSEPHTRSRIDWCMFLLCRHACSSVVFSPEASKSKFLFKVFKDLYSHQEFKVGNAPSGSLLPKFTIVLSFIRAYDIEYTHKIQKKEYKQDKRTWKITLQEIPQATPLAFHTPVTLQCPEARFRLSASQLPPSSRSCRSPANTAAGHQPPAFGSDLPVCPALAHDPIAPCAVPAGEWCV
eukprot:gene12238-2873_t